VLIYGANNITFGVKVKGLEENSCKNLTVTGERWRRALIGIYTAALCGLDVNGYIRIWH
jgi:hypothetical protein